MYKRQVLEGVKNASFDEIVEFRVDDGSKKLGRIVEIYEEKAVIQVFEGTENMSLSNTHTRLSGHPMEVELSPDILGRTFNGIGKPIEDVYKRQPDFYFMQQKTPSPQLSCLQKQCFLMRLQGLEPWTNRLRVYLSLIHI